MVMQQRRTVQAHEAHTAHLEFGQVGVADCVVAERSMRQIRTRRLLRHADDARHYSCGADTLVDVGPACAHGVCDRACNKHGLLQLVKLYVLSEEATEAQVMLRIAACSVGPAMTVVVRGECHFTHCPRVPSPVSYMSISVICTHERSRILLRELPFTPGNLNCCGVRVNACSAAYTACYLLMSLFLNNFAVNMLKCLLCALCCAVLCCAVLCCCSCVFYVSEIKKQNTVCGQKGS